MPQFEQQNGEMRGWQLKPSDRLSQNQYKAISTLIYETDPYIYPALFEGNLPAEEAAVKILPSVFEHGDDAMSRKENLYVYLSEDEIVGLILWNKGRLNWNPSLFYMVAQDTGVQLIEENVTAVSKGYVDDKYSIESEATEQSISLINICVDKRMRGQGIGRKMMTAFMEEHSAEPMELCVLADPPGAICLYENMGFRIANEATEFSLSESKPKCYDMTRPKAAE